MALHPDLNNIFQTVSPVLDQHQHSSSVTMFVLLDEHPDSINDGWLANRSSLGHYAMEPSAME